MNRREFALALVAPVAASLAQETPPTVGVGDFVFVSGHHANAARFKLGRVVVKHTSPSEIYDVECGGRTYLVWPDQLRPVVIRG